MVYPIVLFLLPRPFRTIGGRAQGFGCSIGADFCFFIDHGRGREAYRLPYPATAHGSKDRVQCSRVDVLPLAACVSG
jgi:hypothetical protein